MFNNKWGGEKEMTILGGGWNITIEFLFIIPIKQQQKVTVLIILSSMS